MLTNGTGFNPTYSEDAPTPNEVSGLTGDAVLEFGAPWCGHCMAAEQAVQEAFSEQPNLSHIKIYDGKGKRLGRAFNVTLWPTLIKLHDGVEIARVVRPVRIKDVRELLVMAD